MKRLFYFLLGTCLIILTIGCVTPQRMTALEDDVYQINRRINEINNILGKGDVDRASKAKLGAKTEELHEQISQLNGQIEVIQHQQQLLQDRLDSQEGPLQDQLKALQQSVDEQKNQTAALQEEIKKLGLGSAAEKITEVELYESALEDFKKEQYKKAREKFYRLLDDFPKSEYADNAQFWVAETYYREADYLKAISEYQKVVSNYTDSDKTSSAILKQGYAFCELGEESDCEIFLRRVVEKYPDTEQAKLANKKLEKLETEKASKKEQKAPEKKEKK